MAIGLEVEAALMAKFAALLPTWMRPNADSQARVLGHGGIKLIARAAGDSSHGAQGRRRAGGRQ